MAQNFEQVALNRISAYAWNSANGLKSLPDDELSYLRSLAEYQNGYWYRDEFQRMLFGKTKLLFGILSSGALFFVPMDDAKRNKAPIQLNKPADSVAFNSLSGLSAALYFDRATGRLSAEELTGSFQREHRPITRRELFTYDDYRAIDGVLEPHVIQYTRDNTAYEIRLERVVYNQTIDPSKFDVPSETQVGLPSLIEVLTKATANQEKLLGTYDQYQYEERYDGCDQMPDSDGNIGSGCWNHQTTRTMSFYRGFPVRRLDYDSWERLNSDKEARRYAETISKIDQIIAKKTRPGKVPNDANTPLEHPGLVEFTDEGWGKAIYAALKQSNFRNYRRQRVAERECLAIDFSHISSDSPSIEQSGTLWLDAKDFVVYRLTRQWMRLPKFQNGAYKVGALDFDARDFPGRLQSPTTFEQIPICEAFWLPKLVKGHGETTFANYRRDGKMIACTDKPVVK